MRERAAMAAPGAGSFALDAFAGSLGTGARVFAHRETSRGRRMACSASIAVAQHALLLVWLASLGSIAAAPPPRLVVSLEALSSGSPVATGSGAASAPPSVETRLAEAPVAAPPPKVEVAELETPKAEPTPAPVVQPKPVAAKPRPREAPAKPTREPQPAPAKRGEHAAPSTTAAEGSATPGADAVAGDGAPGTGSAKHGEGGTGSAESSYRARLLDLLARQKRYPARARSMGLEGEVLLSITVGRDGRVKARTASSSSGATVFAREAEAMVDRANPFPSVPESMEGASLEFRVPIRFELDEAGG